MIDLLEPQDLSLLQDLDGVVLAALLVPAVAHATERPGAYASIERDVQ